MSYWNRHLLDDEIFSARKISFSVSTENGSSVKFPNQPVRTFINLIVLFVLGIIWLAIVFNWLLDINNLFYMISIKNPKDISEIVIIPTFEEFQGWLYNKA